MKLPKVVWGKAKEKEECSRSFGSSTAPLQRLKASAQEPQMGRGPGRKQGCRCLHQQQEEGGICYTWHFVFLLPCFKLWEDVAGCFLWCWSHFHSHSAASSKEQLHCQPSSPCRSCCSFLLQSTFLLWNCRSGAGSPKYRGEEGEKHRPRWGSASLPGVWPNRSSQQDQRATTYSSLCCLCQEEGIFFPCYFFL